jgi:hypothetical protein
MKMTFLPDVSSQKKEAYKNQSNSEKNISDKPQLRDIYNKVIKKKKSKKLS